MYELELFKQYFPLHDVNKNCKKYNEYYIYPFLYNKHWIFMVNKTINSFNDKKYDKYKKTMCMTISDDFLIKKRDVV